MGKRKSLTAVEKGLETLQRKRNPVAAKMEKTMEIMKELLKEDDKDFRQLDINWSTATRVYNELQGIDEEILNQLLDGQSPDYDEKKEEVEQFADLWTVLSYDVAQARTELHGSAIGDPDRAGSPTPSLAASTTEAKKKKGFKRPEMKIKTFNGELKDWLGFWAQYKLIHEDNDLHDAEKFQTLVQCMAPGTEAEAAVSPFPQTAENYPKVVAALEARFGNPDVLTSYYIREMISLIIANSQTKMKVSIVYDQINAQLQALKSLGILDSQMNCILSPMVESCLPEEVLLAFTRSPYCTGSYAEQLDKLLAFLKKELEMEQRRELAKRGLVKIVQSEAVQSVTTNENKDVKSKKRGGGKKTESNSEIPVAAAGLFNGKGTQCIFCEGLHNSQDCGHAQKMTMKEKDAAVEAKEACFKCLKPGHEKRKCGAFVCCVICHKKHFTIMCPTLPIHQKESAPAVAPSEKEIATQATNLNLTGAVLLQTLVVRAVGNGVTKVIRLLLDSGSQGSHVKTKTAEHLKLKAIGEVTMRKVLFGGHQTEARRHRQFELNLESLDGTHGRTLQVVEESDLCGGIPSIPNGPWMEELEKKNIHLSDQGAQNVDIELLVGSDYWGSLMTGQMIQLKEGLMAMETVFGWTVSGPLPGDGNGAMTVTRALFVENVKVSDLWELDTIGIKDPIEVFSKEEKERMVTEHFAQTVKRQEDGRYSVSLPWRDGQPQKIPNNRAVAEARLKTTTKKLKAAGYFQQYQQVFDSWLEEGLIEEVTEESVEVNAHFLPHRAVIKPESSTTPVRPVFDASCKTGRNPSLNEVLEKGPNLMEKIPPILLRFREKAIGLLADLRKAFQMIGLDSDGELDLVFLWWEDETCTRIKIYKHKRVVFGINCSPFQLAAVILYILSHVKDEDKAVALQLLISIYVDNVLSSLNTVEQYEKFREDSIRIFKEAKMDLRDWHRNGAGISHSEAIVSALGLKWDKRSDELMLDFEAGEALETLSKRKILSSVHRIFDPLGFASPVTLQPKLMLQELWAKKLGWDSAIPVEVEEKFRKWYDELPSLQQVRIPRQLVKAREKDGIQIHTFGDASQSAYAAVVFIRSVEDGEVHVQLAQSKSRVSPLKKPTIPRLELLASLIGARLAASTKEALGLEEVEWFFWSDSTTSLAWIRRNDDWGTFVGNRVKEILTICEAEDWSYVPGGMNPADLPSRGCSANQLLASRWWEGPAWLKYPSTHWPSSEASVDEEEVSKEAKKTSGVMVSSGIPAASFFQTNFLSYAKNVRVLAYMRRFIDGVRKRKNPPKVKFILIGEFREAEMELLKIIQGQCFQKDATRQVGICITPMEDGLLHVVSRLVNKEFRPLFKAPILLPANHPLIHEMIREIHRAYGHVGTQHVLRRTRERFWIIHGRLTVKRALFRCTTCRRYESKPYQVDPATLPERRVQLGGVFETTGVDLAGPLFLKDGSKRWIVIFTCAVYRGVHLDLLSALSTEAFLESLERFVNFFGRPVTIYSDNGTNFVGSVNFFKKLNWEKIESETRTRQIKWIFNPPTAAWWGGWWERLIRIVKDLLKRILGNRRVSEEKLRTCLSTVAAALNDRPLTTMTEDPDDFLPLTPNTFLRGSLSSGFPEALEITGKGLREDHKVRSELHQQLKGRFRNEYLSALVQRGKEKTKDAPKIGDIVLVGSEKKRLEWPMGRIVELIISKRDQKIRMAMVKTKDGIKARALQSLYPLEIPHPDASIIQEKDRIKEVKEKKKPAQQKTGSKPKVIIPEPSSPVVITKSGRVSRKPQ